MWCATIPLARELSCITRKERKTLPNILCVYICNNKLIFQNNVSHIFKYQKKNLCYKKEYKHVYSKSLYGLMFCSCEKTSVLLA